jgi:hypothetical protein
MPCRAEVTGRKSQTTPDLIERSAGPPVPGEDEPTQHRNPKKAKRASKPQIRDPPMAYGIREFCELHRISVDLYFRLRRRGDGPVTMKVGGRTLISMEAAAAWRRSREAQPVTNTTA